MFHFRALLLCALVCGCHPRPTAQEHPITDPKKLAALHQLFVPKAYLHPEDQKKAQRLRDGYSGPTPCEHEKIEGGVRVIAATQVDECFKMTKPQRWRGLWRHNLEASDFCVAPASECPAENQNDLVWLEMRAPLPGAEDTPPGGLYAIDFVGRRTSYPGVYDEGANEEVIVDRLISIKLVEPPPPGQMTRELVEGYVKDCSGKPICMPNSEVPKARVHG